MQHPQARYELDWKTPEQLLVAAVLADGSRDAAVTDVTKVLFARWPDTRALPKADIAQLTQVSCRTPRQPSKPAPSPANGDARGSHRTAGVALGVRGCSEVVHSVSQFRS